MMASRSYGPGTAAIMRAMFDARRPLTQVAIAERCAVSQPAVSLALARLKELHAVKREEEGWVARRELAAVYSARVVPKVIDTWLWSSLDPQHHQVAAVSRAAEGECLVSADVGADLLDPWRSPTRTIVYVSVNRRLDLTRQRFVTSNASPTMATVEVRATPDRRMLDDYTTAQTATGSSVRVAHPLQVAADLIRLGGHDRADAATRMIERFIKVPM